MNEYQSRYIDLLHGTGPPLPDNQKHEIYDRLLSEATQNPEAARELDIRVMNAAYERRIPSEIATRIIAQGPYLQSQLERGTPIGALTTDYLTPLSTAYVRREAADAIAEINSERQQRVEQAVANHVSPPVAQAQSVPQAVVKTSAVFLGAGYNVMRVAEQSLFAIAPLPLQQLKTGIQQVGVPLAITAVASRLPGMQPLVTGAMQFGGDLLGNGASAATSHALNALGQQLQSALPNGLGIQTMTGAIGSAVGTVTTNLAQKSGQFLGETATAVGVGKFVLNGAQSVFSEVREKGPMRTIEEAIVGAQQAIARTQDFLRSAHRKVTALINHVKGVEPMSQQQPEESQQPSENLDATPVNEPTPGSFLQNSIDSVEQGIQELDQSLAESEASYAQIRDDQAQMLESQSQMRESFAQMQETLREMEIPNPSPQISDSVAPESPIEGNGFHLEQEPDTDGISYTVPQTEQPEDIDFYTPQDLESEPNAQAIAGQKAPIQKENEDYALSLQNMLAQRGIDTQRFQIDVNGQTAFKMENSLVSQNNLSAEDVEAVKTALNDPAKMKGEVRITQGSKVLLHVKNGQVINDPLGLTKTAAKVEVNSPSQMLYDQSSRDVQGVGLERTQAIAANAIITGASQTQVMEMIKSHDPEYKNQVKEQGSEQAATQAIGAAVRAAETQVAMGQQPESAQAKEPALQR